MIIIHDAHSESRLYCVGFIENGEGMNIGVIGPGEYDLGSAKCDEIITVIVGEIIINGTRCKPFFFHRKKKIKKGELITLETAKTSIYLRKTKGYR